MKTKLLMAVVAVVLFSGIASAAPLFDLRVPVEIDNLPAAVTKGTIDCSISSDAVGAPTRRSMGSGRTEFAIENGHFSGRVGVAIVPTGYPVGVDGTLDIHSYHCTLHLLFRCTASDGTLGWCTSGPGGRAISGGSAAYSALFDVDPARAPHGTIEGAVDRSTATTLPIRR